jgi:predicted metalloprotease with PDZ domain
MIQRLLPLWLFILLCTSLAAQQPGYRFSVDLTRIAGDKLDVELLTPSISSNEIIYNMPAIVPGTYEVYDYGRFLSDFKAFDKNGNKLKTESVDKNRWKITDAKQLHRITYRVEDTWDTNQEGEFIFEPGGTNFQADSNFVLNTFGLCGYFDGMKTLPFELHVRHSEKMFGATSLRGSHGKQNDTLRAPDYMELADSPVMYAAPDTAHVMVGGCDVLLALYSPNHLCSAPVLADTLRDLLAQQQAYLGGTLPVDRYTFIIYLSPDGYKSGSLGALEHSYSSLYCLPEMMPYYIGPRMRDICAHEFFHIVTPLSIHSEEIGDFNYNGPKMSQHLWLYEGLTEYAAGLMQVKYGHDSPQDFLQWITNKINGSERFNNTLPFTEMSKGVLDTYKNEYSNVYQKGALIGLCLDLNLRKLSDGKYGVQELMRDLSKTYGKNKSFKDDELIPKIVQLTYPEIGTFFSRYVQGSEPLPLAEVLAYAGISYTAKSKEKILDPLGGMEAVYDMDTQAMLLVDIGKKNEFGYKMDYREGDRIVAINGIKTNSLKDIEKIQQLLDDAREGMKIKVDVIRKEEETGKEIHRQLKGKLKLVETLGNPSLALDAQPDATQLRIRKAWINK